MPTYVIERDLPGIGSADEKTLAEAAGKSNDVLEAMRSEGKSIQWAHSYVTKDKTFCVYIADSEALIHEHAERSGFPASIINEIGSTIDPSTANWH